MFAIEGGFAEGIVNVASGKVTQYGESAYIVNGNPILQVSTVPDGSAALAEYTKALNAGKPFFVVSFAKNAGQCGRVSVCQWACLHGHGCRPDQ